MKKQSTNKRGNLYGAMALFIGGAIALLYFMGGNGQRANPAIVATEELTMLETVQRAMDGIPLIDILDVVVNDLGQIIQVVYRIPSGAGLDVVKLQMQDIVCAYKSTGIDGYRLRMGGKNANDVTLITAALESDVLNQIDCDAGAILWESAASEWSVASGLQ